MVIIFTECLIWSFSVMSFKSLTEHYTVHVTHPNTNHATCTMLR